MFDFNTIFYLMIHKRIVIFKLFTKGFNMRILVYCLINLFEFLAECVHRLTYEINSFEDAIYQPLELDFKQNSLALLQFWQIPLKN